MYIFKPLPITFSIFFVFTSTKVILADTNPTVTVLKPIVSADLHGKATLACSVKELVISHCIFQKVGTFRIILINSNSTMGVNGTETSVPGYFYIGAGLDKGECGLQITNVTEKDVGNWSCQLIFPKHPQGGSTGNVQLELSTSDYTFVILERTNPTRGRLLIRDSKGHETVFKEEVVLYRDEIHLATESSQRAICWLSEKYGPEDPRNSLPSILPVVRCDWNGNLNVILISGVSGPKQILEFQFVIDPLASNIYWKHKNSNGVWATSVIAHQSTKLIQVKGNANFMFVINTRSATIFLGYHSYRSNDTIKPVRISTTIKAEIVNGFKSLRGLTFDKYRETLYWATNDKVCRANFNRSSSSLNPCVQLMIPPDFKKQFLNLQYYKNRLYWQIDGGHTVETDLKTNLSQVVVKRNNANPYAFAVWDKLSKPSTTNPCSEQNCTENHLCIPLFDPLTSRRYACRCPVGSISLGTAKCVYVLAILNYQSIGYLHNFTSRKTTTCDLGRQEEWASKDLGHIVTNRCRVYTQNQSAGRLEFDRYNEGWISQHENCVEYHSFRSNRSTTLHCVQTLWRLESYTLDLRVGILFFIQTLASGATYEICSRCLGTKCRTTTAQRIGGSGMGAALAANEEVQEIYWIENHTAIFRTGYYSGTKYEVLKLEHHYPMRILKYAMGVLWWNQLEKTSASISGYENVDNLTAITRPTFQFQVNNISIDDFSIAISSFRKNPCEYANCSHVCIPLDNAEFICACPDATLLVNGICKLINLMVTTRRPFYSGNFTEFLIMPAPGNKMPMYADFKQYFTVPEIVNMFAANFKTGRVCWFQNGSTPIIKCELGGSRTQIPAVSPTSKLMNFDTSGDHLFWKSSKDGCINVHTFSSGRHFSFECSYASNDIGASVLDTDRIIFFWVMNPNTIHYQYLEEEVVLEGASELGSKLLVTSLAVDPTLDILYMIQGNALRKIRYDDLKIENSNASILHQDDRLTSVITLELYEHYVIGMARTNKGVVFLFYNLENNKLSSIVPSSHQSTFGTHFKIFEPVYPAYKPPRGRSRSFSNYTKSSIVRFDSNEDVYITSTQSYQTSFNESSDFVQTFVEYLTPVTLSSGAGILVVLSLTICICCPICSNRTEKLSPEQILPLREPANASNNDNPIPSSSTAASPNNELPIPLECVITSSELHVDETIELGSGQFATVFQGTYRSFPVAVKTLKLPSATSTMTQFCKEVCIIAKIGAHPTVVRYFGTDTSGLANGTIRVIFELSPFGSLLNFLRNSDGSIDRNRGTLKESIQSIPTSSVANNVSLNQMMSWSNQIAFGMSFLHEKRIIHGDLATRNVLVFHDSVVKLSDFGFSRSLYKEAVYVKQNPDPLPWRWMAVESLKNLQFSTKTDVWSYGVTLWEIFSSGLMPFPQYSWNDRFLRKIEEGNRLPKPESAPIQVYETVMLPCWKLYPTERPDFNDLILRLAEIPLVTDVNASASEWSYGIPKQ